MTIDEWNDRRIDDLAAQVRLMAPAITLIASHDVKIDGVQDDMRELREALRDAVAAQGMALREIGKTCEDHTRRVERKIDAQAKKIDEQALAQAKKLDEQALQREAQKFSRPQQIALLAAVFGPTLGFVALLLGVGPG